MATEILPSDDDEEGGSTESVSGSGSTEEEEEEIVGAPAAALCEQCQLARQADEELIRRLQSECGELRAQRAEAESQLVVIEDDRRREADRTKEEMARRVAHCLKGYAHWEVAAQERLTLRARLTNPAARSSAKIERRIGGQCSGQRWLGGQDDRCERRAKRRRPRFQSDP
ncbi:hypothetical protein AXG93_723s1230 [Marchantia polymorpha subsp. ruderalis]|uniref:Uncharacterized protein n=1 Tax=Marchantia polymorpha subsp. ruderalis TaxID=1480154 RepID=A0A176VD82_MARPO|nr:hypothetical protein AXG93_723s1230 [Marchantia polymorpha subsp. ruderalis]